MVLTRRQEALLRKQYKLDENSSSLASSEGHPTTPRTGRRGIVQQAGEQHTGLRSALKRYHTDRPWEDREIRMLNNMPTVDTNKHVTIESEKNVVFEFETSQSDGGDHVRRQLDLSDDGEEENGEYLESGEEVSKEDNVGEEYRQGGVSEKCKDDRHTRWRRNAITHDMIMAFLMLLLWSFSSSCLTVVMQSVLMHERMSLPLMVPGLSQLGCVIVVRVLDRFKMITLKPMPPLKEYMRKIFPLALSTCTCMFLGNYAYIGLSLSFLSILKALTPAVTLILAVIGGMETLSGTGLFSTLLIAYGTGIATVDETNKDVDFHWNAFISFTTSVLFEASRVVFVSKSLKNTKYSSFDLLAGVGPLIFAMMTTMSLFLERHTLLALTPEEVSFIARTMVLIIALSFAVNISTYAAIKYSSSTTVKVVGCLKNALLMWFGILYQGDVVSSTQWQGFALSTGGFLLYAYSRNSEEAPSAIMPGNRKKA